MVPYISLGPTWPCFTALRQLNKSRSATGLKVAIHCIWAVVDSRTQGSSVRWPILQLAVSFPQPEPSGLHATTAQPRPHSPGLRLPLQTPPPTRPHLARQRRAGKTTQCESDRRQYDARGARPNGLHCRPQRRSIDNSSSIAFSVVSG